MVDVLDHRDGREVGGGDIVVPVGRSVTWPRGGSVERIMPTRARPTIGLAFGSMQTIGSTV